LRHEKASSALPLKPTDLPSLLTEQIAHLRPFLIVFATPSDQRGKPTYRAFLRKLTHCTVPGLTNDRFGLLAPPIIMVKAFLRPGLPVCDLENTYFRSPFWLDIGISQTKSGSSLLALRDWRGEGQWGNSTLAKW
jgi:hypothetical protein